MSTYFIGDVHGCYNNLQNALQYIHFDPNKDSLFFTGDLVSRGPHSLEVLRLIKGLKSSACTVLGNHDLYLLKSYFCMLNCKKNNNNFNDILHAPDSKNIINWLRKQPLLYIDEKKKIIMSHAGINPKWNIDHAKIYAQEIEKILTSDHAYLLFQNISQLNKKKINPIDNDKLKSIQRNLISFTRMRYVHANGTLDLKCKEAPQNAPKNIYPWFNLSQPILTSGYKIIFGHWASLKHTNIPPGIYGLDSGCCWGGYLTLLRWEDKKIIRKPCIPPN